MSDDPLLTADLPIEPPGQASPPRRLPRDERRPIPRVNNPGGLTGLALVTQTLAMEPPTGSVRGTAAHRIASVTDSPATPTPEGNAAQPEDKLCDCDAPDLQFAMGTVQLINGDAVTSQWCGNCNGVHLDV